jgi:hypothetical protein
MPPDIAEIFGNMTKDFGCQDITGVWVAEAAGVRRCWE